MKVKKQTFMKGILTVLIAQILVKCLGFIYRVIITNFEGFGDKGNNNYGTAYTVYTLFLSLSLVGIPSVVSKLVSEKMAVGEKKGAYKIFKVALSLFAIIGIVLFLILFVFSKFISTHILVNVESTYSLAALAPAVFFVTVSAVFRGFFAGLKDMRAQGTSQVLEQLFNCAFSILAVSLLVSQFSGSPEIMAMGSALGTTFATIISTLYLVVFYLRRRHDILEDMKNSAKEKQEATKSIIKKIMRLVIPISIASIILSLSGVIDVATVKRCLLTFMSEDAAKDAVGILVGKVDILTNLPLALNVAFSIVLVPTIAGAIAVGNVKNAKDKTSFSLLITMLIGLSCVVGLVVLAQPILNLLFPRANEGAILLQIATVAVIFSAIAQTLSGTLQGLGRVSIPAIATLIGASIKLVLNLILIPIPSIGIYGAAIASIAGQLTIAIIMFVTVNKALKLKLNIIKYVVKPVVVSLIMGAAAFFAYETISNLLPNTIATLTSMVIAIIVFLVLVIIFKIFNKEEIENLPMGKNIYKMLVKIKVYN